ncbi:MAG: aldo/keto reductase [Dysgonamonadaceae bacterium]|jgi:aryl-alcohol dehydrogenase-like predicted oxidoreductase|nr:aldo/keto reductase [Dysgonamonadaceae bacterium]
MKRRSFLKAGFSLAGISVMPKQSLANISLAMMPSAEMRVDKVRLGKSGLSVSRIAMGTGTHGGNKESDFTRQGMDSFVRLAHHAYERGIRFYDTADSYGTIPYVGEAIKTLPRKKITLLTKMWTHDDGSPHLESVDDNINRYLKEFGTDYIDILLMHCMMSGEWNKKRSHYMEGFLKAKKAGKVRAIGVSCHNIDALRVAAVEPWVDIIMARINPFQTMMDGSPDEIKAILGTAKKNGKGLIAMKIFGEGKNVRDDEREQSIRFAIRESNAHCMTLGMMSIAQIDDAVQRVMKNQKS